MSKKTAKQGESKFASEATFFSGLTMTDCFSVLHQLRQIRSERRREAEWRRLKGPGMMMLPT